MRSAITDGVVFSGTITSNVRGQIIFRAFVLLSVNRDMTKLNGRFRRGATLFFFLIGLKLGSEIWPKYAGTVETKMRREIFRES